MIILQDDQMEFLKNKGYKPSATLVHITGKKRKFYHVLSEFDIKEQERKWALDNSLGEHLKFKSGELCLYPAYTGNDDDDSSSDEESEFLGGEGAKRTGSSTRDLLYIAGRSGAGKSTIMSKYAVEYNKVNPKNKIVMITATNPLHEDGIAGDNFRKLKTLVFDVSKPEVVASNFLSDCNLSLDDIADSLLIVDDVEALLNRAHHKAIMNFVNQVLMQGRHFRISVCMSRHLAAGGQDTKTIINESRWVVTFPYAGGNLNYFYKNHCDINTDEDKRYIKGAGSRYIFVHKSNPNFMFGERFIKPIADNL